MKPENKLWALEMLRAVQKVLENEGIEDLRTDDGNIGEKLEDLIATIEDTEAKPEPGFDYLPRYDGD